MQKTSEVEYLINEGQICKDIKTNGKNRLGGLYNLEEGDVEEERKRGGRFFGGLKPQYAV